MTGAILVAAAIWTIAAAIGAIAIVAVACRWAWATIRDWWLRATAVIKKTQGELSSEPVPHWPAEHAMLLIALCGPCQGRDGDCICPIQCGELPCMGGFSDEDVRFLRGLSMPEGTDQ